MKESEAAVVLALCATFDRRTIGRSDATAWTRVLGDVTVEDACAAVDAWYADRRDWIMPSDVRAQALAAARRREGIEARARIDAEIAAAGRGEVTDRSHPLRALMAGTPIKSAPRADWQRRRALPARSVPPFTDEELAAARRLLDEAKPEDAR